MRRLAALLALLFAAPVALGAANAPPARHPWTQPGHLRIGVLRDIDTIVPLLSIQAATTDVAQLVFSGLIRYDAEGNAIPDAATAVPTRANGGISADGRTITYHLRPDARFSDGRPLTADDVVFTWHAILDPKLPVPNHFPYDQATSVTAKDPHTVIVRLRAPSAAFVTYFMRCGTQGSILPAHLLRGADLVRGPYALQPIGSGPFKIERYRPGNGIELVRNDAWFGPRPKLDRISYEIIPNENSLLVALRSHEIDFYYNAPEQELPVLRGIPGVTVHARPFASFEAVWYNARRAPMDDARVRRAITAAIDWHQLARATYLDVDLPGVTDVFPHSWAFDPGANRVAPRDVALAKRLLDEAGWRGEGTRAKDGHALTLTMRTVAGVIPRQNAEVLIQQELREVGVQAEVLNAPANQLFAAFGAGGLLAKGDFDLAIYGWTQAPDPSDDAQTISPDAVPPYGANYSGLRDAEIGRLQREGNARYERAARRPYYVALQRREAEVDAFHTIVWRANIDAVNEDFRGFAPAVALSDFWNPWAWEI